MDGMNGFIKSDDIEGGNATGKHQEPQPKSNVNVNLHLVVGNALPRVPSFPKLKPHFIITEYYGKTRRESQTFYLEEKYCQSPKSLLTADTVGTDGTSTDAITGNTVTDIVTANADTSITDIAIIGTDQQRGRRHPNQRSMFENVALFGGAFVGGILGLYVCNNN